MQKKNTKGAVAIEFAIVFPVFFMIFYAIVTYGIIFATQQTLTLAAAEGARAAVRYPVNLKNNSVANKYEQLQSRLAEACAAAIVATDWLLKIGKGVGINTACGNGISSSAGFWITPGICGNGTSGFKSSTDTNLLNCVIMQVNYNYAAAPLVPKLLGPLLSFPTPDFLQGRAAAQISLID